MAAVSKVLRMARFSATVGTGRFQGADDQLIRVSQQHINELEAGSFKQGQPECLFAAWGPRSQLRPAKPVARDVMLNPVLQHAAGADT